jgi:hypothetical protein
MLTKAQEFHNTFSNPNFSYWGEDSYEPQFGKIKPKPTSVTSSQEFLESIGKDRKDFLLLSRHWKLHRLLLLSHLHKIGFDKSLVSWDNRYHIPHMIDQMYIHDKNEEFGKLSYEDKKQYLPREKSVKKTDKKDNASASSSKNVSDEEKSSSEEGFCFRITDSSYCSSYSSTK